MTRFRSRSVEIDAIEVREAIRLAGHDWSHVPAWVRDVYEAGALLFCSDSVMLAMGRNVISVGADSWLVRGVCGEIRTCGAKEFAALYEPA